MGASKYSLFSTEQNRMALITKAFGHPARIAIIEYLSENERCACNELVDHIPLSQATISQHLKELKNVGIITSKVIGNSILYCINDQSFKEIKQEFEKFLNGVVTLERVA